MILVSSMQPGSAVSFMAVPEDRSERERVSDWRPAKGGQSGQGALNFNEAISSRRF